MDAVGRKIDLRHGVADIQSDTTGNTEEKLNAIDGDAASKQEGIQELSDLLTSQAGVAGQEMLVYMNDNDAAAGMHHNAGNMSGVNASVTDMTDGAAIVQTAVHETTHHILNEKNDTYSAETKEYAATQDGDYAKKLWEQQNRRNGNTTGGTAQDIANWNANNSNSGLIAANNQRVAEVPKAEREELLPVLIIGGIKLAEVALTAYEAKQLKDAYDRGEVSNQELAEMAAMNAATSAAGLIPVPGSSVASKILAKGAERLRTHVDEPSATGSPDVREVTQARNVGDVDVEMIGQNGPTYNAVINSSRPAEEVNQEMINAGYVPAWTDGTRVQDVTLMPGYRAEQMIEKDALPGLAGVNPEQVLGRWAVDGKLPNQLQESRDVTGVKEAWKRDPVIAELEVVTPLNVNRGSVREVYDEGLDRLLPGKSEQLEFIEGKKETYQKVKINDLKEFAK